MISQPQRDGDPRYSILPLIELLACSDSQVTRRLRMSGASLNRYRAEGVSEQQAEALALRAGFHPFNVWPELTAARCESMERECAAPDCDVRFVRAFQSRRIWCHPRCKWRTDARKRRATPDGAAANRERRRRYYAENSDYERARQRRANTRGRAA